jgi:dTMP kinase
LLINITGIDGCGKGTQLGHLADFLRSKNKPVFMSKAYGDAEKELFALFMETATPEGVLFLFQALHAEQRAKAEKALKRGEIVLADRWDDSYEAYHSQNGILSSDQKLRFRLNEIAFGGICADITFLLKVPVDIAMERCRIRGADFFDLKGREYHQSLSDRMDQLAAEQNWVVLDGTLPHREIHRRTVETISHYMLF